SQAGFFESLRFTTVLVRLDGAGGSEIENGAKSLSLHAGTQPPRAFSLTDGQGSVSGLNWAADKLPPTWSFEFDLRDPDLAVLLEDGFVDGKKLLDMQVIVLYEAKVF
ncbi:MAG: hypothetical protein MI919_02445, partial [Holophagales bacterium]|nr:hypothetical protein [Holophagales bacterium]